MVVLPVTVAPGKVVSMSLVKYILLVYACKEVAVIVCAVAFRYSMTVVTLVCGAQVAVLAF